MDRNHLVVFIILLSLNLLVAGCNIAGTMVTQDVTVEQLLAHPNQFDGVTVNVEGFYFQGFEVIVLSDKLEYSGYAPGHLVPRGEMIWIEGGIPLEVYDNLQQQNMMGPTERYGKVRMTGTFHYGDKYGHAGAYEYQISPSEVELLPWAPPL